MRRIENAAFAIFEDSEQQAQADGDVGDVGNGNEHMPVRRERFPHARQELRRIAKVFEDVSQNDDVRAGGQTAHRFQIGDDRLIESRAQVGDAIDVEFESDRSPEFCTQRVAELSAGGAEVKQRGGAVGVARDEVDQNAMTAALEIFEGVDVRHESVPSARYPVPRVHCAGCLTGHWALGTGH